MFNQIAFLGWCGSLSVLDLLTFGDSRGELVRYEGHRAATWIEPTRLKAGYSF